jgi:hypothetical protein
MNGPPPGCCGFGATGTGGIDRRGARAPPADPRYGRVSQGAVAPARRRQERWRAGDLLLHAPPGRGLLADLYAKNEKENLTHAERNQLQKIASEVQRECGG